MGEIHRLTQFANEYKDDFIKDIGGHTEKVVENEFAHKHRELDVLRARDKELDNLFEWLYEDNVSGKISDVTPFPRYQNGTSKSRARTTRKSRHSERNFRSRALTKMNIDVFLEQSGDIPEL